MKQINYSGWLQTLLLTYLIGISVKFIVMQITDDPNAAPFFTGWFGATTFILSMQYHKL